MHALNPPSRLREVMDPEDGPFVEAPPPRPKRWPKVLLLVGLLLITAIGGFLRFYRIDRPGVWVDEASTYRRTCGTYGEMLNTLERDPFTPLFYSFEWSLRNWRFLVGREEPDVEAARKLTNYSEASPGVTYPGTDMLLRYPRMPMTPFWLRLLPAIAGTLMVPAMYFLARQLASVRTALIATILTCTSSFLINYSRDAKMYMTFWLFVTLTAGSYFWWLRRHTWTSWLCWIVSGCAMMGLNVWGGVVMVLLPVFLLTARRVHWVMGLGFVVGAAVILSGTIGYYTLFNNYIDKAEDRRGPEGISWVEWRNEGADGPELVRDSASAFLYSFTFLQENFPDNIRNPERRLIPPKPVLTAAVGALGAIGLLFVLGAMPWRRADAVPPPTAPEPWWRSTLWVATWLIVPTYLFYCINFQRAMPPIEWLWGLDDFLERRWWLFALATLAAAGLVTRWKPAGTILLCGVGAVVLWSLWPVAWAFLKATREASLTTDTTAKVINWDLPLAAIDQWVIQLFERPVIWPVLVFVGGVAIARSAPTWKGRGGRILATVFVTALVFGVLIGVYLAAEAVKAEMRRRGFRMTSMWVPRYLGFIWPALAIALAAMLARLPSWPFRWTAVAAVVALNLLVSYHRVLGHTEPPLDRVMADMAADTDVSATRTFVPQMPVSGGPGAAQWWSSVGIYYLLQIQPQLSHNPHWLLRPQEFYNRNGINVRMDDSQRELLNQARNPKVNRIVVWRAQRNPETPLRNGWDIVPRMGGSWRLASEEIMPVRYHWCWATRYVYVRREYTR